MRLGSASDYNQVGQTSEDGDDMAVECEEGYINVFSFIFLVCAGLVYISMAAVPPLSLAISYNSFTKAADTSNVYAPGRHFIGPFNKFLYFPSDVHTIEFSNDPKLVTSGIRYAPLHTRTKEGLALHLQVSLQYRLIADKVGSLYNEFNQNYENVFVSAVRDVLIKAASEYNAGQLWTERHKFGNRMQQMVNDVLQPMYASCWGLQLMKIDLPDTFEASLVRTQVQQQSRLMLEQEQRVQRIKAETTVIGADYDRKAKVILAQGHGNYTLTTQKAQAVAQRQTVDAQTAAISIIKSSLGLDAAGLVTYQRYDAVDELGSASVFFGFGGVPQVLFGSGGH